MAVFFSYLVKSDLPSARYCTREHWISHVLQCTRKRQPCLTDQPVDYILLSKFEYDELSLKQHIFANFLPFNLAPFYRASKVEFKML